MDESIARPGSDTPPTPAGWPGGRGEGGWGPGINAPARQTRQKVQVSASEAIWHALAEVQASHHGECWHKRADEFGICSCQGVGLRKSQGIENGKSNPFHVKNKCSTYMHCGLLRHFYFVLAVPGLFCNRAVIITKARTEYDL